MEAWTGKCPRVCVSYVHHQCSSVCILIWAEWHMCPPLSSAPCTVHSLRPCELVQLAFPEAGAKLFLVRCRSQNQGHLALLAPICVALVRSLPSWSHMIQELTCVLAYLIGW